MSYNTYKPNEVEIDWLILSKLTKHHHVCGLYHDDNVPLEKEELKKLFLILSELEIEELLDQVFTINKDLYKFLIKILNDDDTDNNYEKYITILKNIEELFRFTWLKNTLLKYEIHREEQSKIDFNILEKIIKYRNEDFTYFVHHSPNELRNITMNMTMRENIQLLEYFYRFNLDLYILFQNILYHEEWSIHSEYRFIYVEEENYSEFKNMLEATIEEIYFTEHNKYI
jgi:hypothetical protein